MGWWVDRQGTPKNQRQSDAGATKDFLTSAATDSATSVPCPSVLDVARLESGDVNETERTTLAAHALRCTRCQASLREFREARHEILGLNDHARSRQSRLAADEIQNLLRRRLLH